MDDERFVSHHAPVDGADLRLGPAEGVDLSRGDPRAGDDQVGDPIAADPGQLEPAVRAGRRGDRDQSFRADEPLRRGDRVERQVLQPLPEVARCAVACLGDPAGQVPIPIEPDPGGLDLGAGDGTAFEVEDPPLDRRAFLGQPYLQLVGFVGTQGPLGPADPIPWGGGHEPGEAGLVAVRLGHCPPRGMRIVNRPSGPLVALGERAACPADVGRHHGGAGDGPAVGATTRPLTSTVSCGFSATGSSRAAASAFGFMAGLGSSGRPASAAIQPAEARATAARAAVVASLIWFISIPLKRVRVRIAAPAETGPPVAARTVDRVSAAGTAAEAPLATKERRPPGRRPLGGSGGP